MVGSSGGAMVTGGRTVFPAGEAASGVELGPTQPTPSITEKATIARILNTASGRFMNKCQLVDELTRTGGIIPKPPGVGRPQHIAEPGRIVVSVHKRVI